jgi:hypothetical protein
MSLFNDYKNSSLYAFIEKVARWCADLVYNVIDRLKGNK